MMRLLRRLFALAAAVSLVLCVAVIVLWVRSYWVGDAIYRETRTHANNLTVVRFAGIYSGWGGLCVQSRQDRMADAVVVSLQQNPAADAVVWHRYPDDPPYPDPHPDRRPTWPLLNSLGFGLTRESFAGPARNVRVYDVTLPYWSLAVAAGVLPGWRLFPRYRRRRRPGLCPACGYDLRATPDRCPECGTPAVAAKGAA